MSGKMNRDLWSCLQWSQLNEKVNPPKEITCEADVKTTMKVEDLNNIIQRLEEKKNTSGFCFWAYQKNLLIAVENTRM